MAERYKGEIEGKVIYKRQKEKQFKLEDRNYIKIELFFLASNGGKGLEAFGNQADDPRGTNPVPLLLGLVLAGFVLVGLVVLAAAGHVLAGLVLLDPAVLIVVGLELAGRVVLPPAGRVDLVLAGLGDHGPAIHLRGAGARVDPDWDVNFRLKSNIKIAFNFIINFIEYFLPRF